MADINNPFPVDSAYLQARDQAYINTALSAAEASKLRNWQEQQNQVAMDFSANQAEANRMFQTFMSNTSHQREVEDLLKAGLNPVLSANNGASTPAGATASGVTSSGAMGEVDKSATQALVGLLSSAWSSSTQLANTATNALLQDKISERQAETARAVAEISGAYGLAGARYTADSAASRQQAEFAHSEYMAQNYPSNLVQALNSIIGVLTGDGGSSGSGLSNGKSIVETAGKNIGSAVNEIRNRFQDWFSSAFGDKDYYGHYGRF